MDEIIEQVGNFGPFQALMFASTCSAIAISVIGMMFMMYGSYNPGWSCLNDTLRSDNTLNLSGVTHESEASCALWRQCSTVVYSKESSTIVTEWNLMCDNSWIPSLIITVEMTGVLVGSWLSGHVGDRFGRRVGLYSMVAFYGIFNVVCAFSSSWQMFATVFFFVGIGVGGILSATFIYYMEFVGCWWRPILASVPIWSFGCIEFAALAYICRDWKTILFASAIISAITFLPAFWMPESMRFLAVHGKHDKVVRIVERMAWWNKKTAVRTEVVDETTTEIFKAQIEVAKPNYTDLFRTTKLRRYSIKFGSIWIMMALVYYMISFGVQSFSGDFYINLILFTLAEVPGNFLVGPLANKIGRRYTGILLFVISAVSSFGVVVSNFIPGSTANNFALISAIIAKTVLVGAWSATFLISVELYPTVVRNLHAGYLNSVSRFGAIISSYIIPADKTKLFIPYSVSGALLLFSALLIYSVSESKGRPMADTIQEMKRIKEDIKNKEGKHRQEV